MLRNNREIGAYVQQLRIDKREIQSKINYFQYDLNNIEKNRKVQEEEFKKILFIKILITEKESKRNYFNYFNIIARSRKFKKYDNKMEAAIHELVFLESELNNINKKLHQYNAI